MTRSRSARRRNCAFASASPISASRSRKTASKLSSRGAWSGGGSGARGRCGAGGGRRFAGAVGAAALGGDPLGLGERGLGALGVLLAAGRAQALGQRAVGGRRGRERGPDALRERQRALELRDGVAGPPEPLQHEAEPQLEVEAVARRRAGRDGQRDRLLERALRRRPVGLQERAPADLRVPREQRVRRIAGARRRVTRLALEPGRLVVAAELGQLARVAQEGGGAEVHAARAYGAITRP